MRPKRAARVGRRMVVMKRLLPVLLLISSSAFAQEYGRASGGDLSMLTKSPAMFRGSLGASFGMGGAKGYLGTASGTLMKDRMWFFGAAEHLQAPRISTTLPQISLGNAVSASLNTQIGDRNTLGASFRSTTPAFNGALPSNFLSLRYTGMISSSSVVTISASQTRR